MFPCISCDNSLNRLLGYPKHAPESHRPKLVRDVQSPNLQHVLVSQFRIWALAATASPILRLAIHYIVSIRTKKQMRGINTRRIVAGVADAHTFGDVAVGKQVRQSMRPMVTAFIPETAIAIRGTAAIPRPALRSDALNEFLIKGVFLDRHNRQHISLLGVPQYG